MHVDHHYVSYNNNNNDELYIGNDGGVYKGNVLEFQDKIITSFNDNMGSGGIMFDIESVNSLDITSFGLNLYSGQKTIYLFYKTGSHIGFETDSTVWFFLDSFNVTSSGSGSQTLINLNTSFNCIQGQKYSFFISNSEWPDMRYISGNLTGSVHVLDSNITIFEGVGRRSRFYNSNIFQNRKFSGTIYYEINNSNSPKSYNYTFNALNNGYQTSQYYNGFAN